MAHPGALGGQDAGCIAPNGLGCNHCAGAIRGRAGRTGCSRRISSIRTQCLSVWSKRFFCWCMPCLSVVASPFAILPSPSSRFCPLATLLLQQLRRYCLLILPNGSSTPRLRPVVVFHYLCAWCPMPWMDVITRATVRLWLQMSAHKSSGFLL